MNMKVNKITAVKLLLSLVIMVGFTSCSKKSESKGGSRATGWKINDKKGWVLSSEIYGADNFEI